MASAAFRRVLHAAGLGLIFLLMVLGCSGKNGNPLAPDSQATTNELGTTLLAASSARHVEALMFDGEPIFDEGFRYGAIHPGETHTFVVDPVGNARLSVSWAIAMDDLNFVEAGNGTTFTWQVGDAEGEARIEATIATPDGTFRRLYRFTVQETFVETQFPIPYPMAEALLHDPYTNGLRASDYEVAQDEILMQIEGDPETLGLERVLRALQLQVLYAYTSRPAYILYNTAGGDLWTPISALRALPFVQVAEPNPMYYIDAIVPNDPDYDLQYCFPLQNVEEAWETTTGDPNQIIAIMDTGTGRQHPDLMAKVVDGADFVTPPGDGLGGEVLGDGIGPDRNVGHGVHCSGISAALSDNDLGGAGMSWESKLMGLRIFPISGDGGTPAGATIGATDFVRDWNLNPANIAKIVAVNMSIGGGGYSQLNEIALGEAQEAGATFTGAAGNGSSYLNAYYPANYEGVIACASVANGDVKSGFSNWGPYVDVAAAGSGIWNTYFKDPPGLPDPNHYASLSGTSMATPQVTGLIGLVKAVAPDLTPAQVTDVIKRTADNIDGINPSYAGFLGAGRINAAAAVTQDLSPMLVAEGITMGDSHIGEAYGNRDGRINPNEKVFITPLVSNVGFRSADFVDLHITTLDDPWLTFLIPDTSAKSISPVEGTNGMGAFLMAVSPGTPDDYEATIGYTIEDPNGLVGPWDLEFTVHIDRNDQQAEVIDAVVTDFTGGKLGRPQTLQPFFSVELPVMDDYLIVDRLRVSLLGTVDPAHVTNVRLWLDDGDHLFQGPAGDTELGQIGYWNATHQSNYDRQGEPGAGLGGGPRELPTYEGATITGAVTFRALRVPAVHGESIRLFVSADLAREATPGNTIGLGVMAPSDAVFSVGDTATGFPWASDVATIINAWTPEIPLTESPGNAWRGSAASDENGHVVFIYDGNTFGDYDIYARISSDGGFTWSSGETNITTNSNNDFIPDVAVDDAGNFHVVFYSTRDGDREIYYMTSADGGATWTAEARIHNTPGNSRGPQILWADDRLHVVWFDEYDTPGDYNIYYTFSDDLGGSWSAPANISQTPTDRVAEDPQIVDAGDTLYVSWDEHVGELGDEGNESQVVYSYLIDGDIWAAPRILTTAPNVAWGSDLAPGDNGQAYVAYHSNETGEDEIWLAILDEDITIEAERVTGFPGSTLHPSIQRSPSGRIDLLFQSGSGPTNIYHYYRMSDVDPWLTPVNLSHNSGGGASEIPVLLREFSTGNMWGFWQDNRSGGTNTWYSQWIES